MTAYRGLLLDFGSVVIKSFFETRGPFERILGLPAGTLDWGGPFAPGEDRLWQDVQRGRISERDYWHTRARETGRLLGREWTIQEFCRKQNEIPLPAMLRPEMVALMADAKRQGIRLGVLTNELELFHGAKWLGTMPFAADLDAVVDATHTGILKPDPRAYHLALERLGLAAGEVVFIDDQIRNVRGGDAVGIRSIHLDVTQPQAAVVEARRLLAL